ncbi:MAG TPA: DUF4286 family protein [Flavitalea sp.]|nr:DUF4286 family protein [Flavitalea sp.]
MIIYNITTLVSWPIHDDWKQWLMNEYIPALMSTKLFSNYQVVRLMEVNEDEGPTYALQLYLNNASDFNNFRASHLELFLKKEKSAWGDYATSFASLMEVIN